MSFTRLFLTAAAIGAALARPVGASPITFNSRSAFNLAAPGLALETFESALVSAGGVTVCSGPLSSAAASACFPLGGLVPGVTYNASTAGLNMVTLGAGFSGLPITSKVLGPNFFSATFNITFSDSPNAVGFDVFPGLTAGNIAISVFSPDTALLGTFGVFGPFGGTFFGVIADGPIGRVNIASQSSLPGELVDNLAFGIVPEPASLTLTALGVAGLLARHRLRRRT
jgi:hypothetical protein